MKKSWFGLVLCVLGVGFFIWKQKARKPPEKKSALSDKADDYQISISVRQKSGAEAESPLISAEGILQQWMQSLEPREYVSEWTEVKELIVMNSAADEGMGQNLLNKLIVSSLEGADGYAHFFGKGFPQDMIPFQVGILQRILLPFSVNSMLTSSPLERNEGDEIGLAKVRYELKSVGDGFEVIKTWLRYEQEGIKVDEHARVVRFELDRNERLKTAEGKIILHYRQAMPARYTIELAVKWLGDRPKTLGKIPPQRESMQRIGRLELAQAVAQTEHKDLFSYDEAMQKLDKVTDQTASSDVYSIFSSLKEEINREPGHAAGLIQRILATKERDASARRRLSILFGALAQTYDAGISTQLASMVGRCADTYCKVQAAAAVNSHPNPSEAAAKEMLRVSDRANDPEVASTALLAAGSAGRRLEGKVENLTKHLLDDLSDPRKESTKTAILAAMGNHGDSEYLGALQSYSVAKDPSYRSAAIYSMRYLPQETVDDVLVAAAGDADPSVVREAYKAMEYRDLSADSFHVLAKKAAAYSDPELQRTAARIFLQAYREDKDKVEAALENFKSNTKMPDMKELLETEVEKIDQEQAAGQALPPEN